MRDGTWLRSLLACRLLILRRGNAPARQPGIELGAEGVDGALLIVQVPVHRHALAPLPPLRGGDVTLDVRGNGLPRIELVLERSCRRALIWGPSVHRTLLVRLGDPQALILVLRTTERQRTAFDGDSSIAVPYRLIARHGIPDGSSAPRAHTKSPEGFP